MDSTSFPEVLSVVERARRYVATMPIAVSGQDGHGATFRVACVLTNGFALPDPDSMLLLHEFNERCQPPWSERELLHKLESAGRATHRHARGYMLNGSERAHGVTPVPRSIPTKRAVAPVNPDVAVEKFVKGFRCAEADLMGSSPTQLSENPQVDAAMLVEALFAPGENVNFVTDFKEDTGKSGKIKARPVGNGTTMERDALLRHWHEHGLPPSRAGGWLRMNPLDGRGICDANVMAFRFALLESDSLPADLQLALFGKLSLPIAAIIASGGNSIHAWVRVDASNADDYRQIVARLFALLARFGVDLKNKNPSRLSRLPGAQREIGADGDGIQRLLYLNPNAEQRSVL